VFRVHRTQVWRPGDTAPAVLSKLQGIAVAKQPLQPSLHSGPGQHIRVQHDVLTANQQRSIRVLLHCRFPAGVHAPATGRRRKTLCLPGTRTPA